MDEDHAQGRGDTALVASIIRSPLVIASLGAIAAAICLVLLFAPLLAEQTLRLVDLVARVLDPWRIRAIPADVSLLITRNYGAFVIAIVLLVLVAWPLWTVRRVRLAGRAVAARERADDAVYEERAIAREERAAELGLTWRDEYDTPGGARALEDLIELIESLVGGQDPADPSGEGGETEDQAEPAGPADRLDAVDPVDPVPPVDPLDPVDLGASGHPADPVDVGFPGPASTQDAERSALRAAQEAADPVAADAPNRPSIGSVYTPTTLYGAPDTAGDDDEDPEARP